MQIEVRPEAPENPLPLRMIPQIQALRQLNHQHLVSRQILRHVEREGMLGKAGAFKPWLEKRVFHWQAA
ncbi:hypothetical protein EON80_23335 [bacterium]|nr:MAG: hypothetical protein EON80_23335 [bacterium]